MKRIPQVFPVVVSTLLALLLALPADAAKNKKPRKAMLKVVSYNLYVGADIFRVMGDPGCGPTQAVHDIHTIIQQTNFPERAEAIADQIMYQEPHVIGLQEVSLLRTQFPGNALAPDGSGIDILGVSEDLRPIFTFKSDAENIQYDYLQILLDALAARGLDYEEVELATATNADVEFPAIEYGDFCTPLGPPTDVRLTDRDVILVRKNLPVNLAFESNFTDNAAIKLDVMLPDGTPAIYTTEFTRGYGLVNVTVKDHNFTVVNAHLEVGDRILPPAEGLNGIQYLQAMELGSVIGSLLEPQASPLVVVGDINSSPASLITDPRPAYGVLSSLPMADLWTVRHAMTDDPGYTFGQNETVDNADSMMFERIDYAFGNFGSLVPDKIKVELLGEEAPDKTPSGLWPSDHAGVAVKLSFEK